MPDVLKRKRNENPVILDSHGFFMNTKNGSNSADVTATLPPPKTHTPCESFFTKIFEPLYALSCNLLIKDIEKGIPIVITLW